MSNTEKEPSTKPRRIHFVTDFVAGDGPEPRVYECQRCGADVLGSRACYRHREGLLSNCRKKRLRALVR